MKLDFSRPYAEIIGIPGAKWEQDGHLFIADGSPALHSTPLVDEPEPVDEDEGLDAQIHPAQPEPDIPVRRVISESLETMHWKRLKILADSLGVDWTNRETVIAEIRGKH